MSDDSRASGIEVTELQGGREQPEHQDTAHHPSKVSTPKPRSPPVRLSSSSSGYCSFEADSAPSSPFLQTETADTAGRRSPRMTHGPQHPSEPLEEARREDGNYGRARSSDQTFPGLSSMPHPVALAPDMQVEIRIGEDLRTIGDQFNTILMARIHLQQRVPMMLVVALLLVVVGRLLYMQVITDILRDPSEL